MSKKLFDLSLVTIPEKKDSLTLNKQAYVGMRILDLRNVLLYEFNYGYIKNKSSSNSRLLFTDTDILIY